MEGGNLSAADTLKSLARFDAAFRLSLAQHRKFVLGENPDLVEKDERRALLDLALSEYGENDRKISIHPGII